KSGYLRRAGFELQNWPDLRSGIKQLADAVDAVEDGSNEYGTFYRVEGILEGATGKVPVMSLPLYDRVALRTSFPEYALRAGDVATLVDFVEHPSSGPRGCVLELFNALGESIAVVTVPEDAIEPLRADEVLAVRPVAAAR
ncbi:MAG: DUF4926 domain-containing protein, partial [Vicinamibacterales bacterium]